MPAADSGPCNGDSLAFAASACENNPTSIRVLCRHRSGCRAWEKRRMNFEQFILHSEPVIRLGFFVGVFAAVALWEVFAPRRALTLGRAVRWASNLGIVVLNTLIVRLLFPAAAVG